MALLAKSSLCSPFPIFSDHLNTVTFINDALPDPPSSSLLDFPPSAPSVSLDSFCPQLIRPRLSIYHVRAHTSASDPASC